MMEELLAIVVSLFDPRDDQSVKDVFNYLPITWLN